MKFKAVVILSLLVCSAYMCGCRDYKKEYEISKETDIDSSFVSATDDEIALSGVCTNQAVSGDGLYYVQDNKIFYYSFIRCNSLT